MAVKGFPLTVDFLIFSGLEPLERGGGGEVKGRRFLRFNGRKES